MAIITVAQVKAYKNISAVTYDAFIATLIPAVQDQVEEYLDRILDQQDFYEWMDYSNIVFFEQYPVNSLKYVGSALKVAEFNSTAYTYEITPTQLIITDGAMAQTTFLLSASATLADLKTTVEATIPAITMAITSGYTTMSYKLLKQGTGRFLYGAERLDVITRTIAPRTLEFREDYSFVFYTSLDLGCYNPLFLIYNAGYTSTTCPKGLQKIIADIIGDIISLNPTSLQGYLRSEQNYNYSYTIGSEIYNYINQEVLKYSDLLYPYKKKAI